LPGHGVCVDGVIVGRDRDSFAQLDLLEDFLGHVEKRCRHVRAEVVRGFVYVRGYRQSLLLPELVNVGNERLADVDLACLQGGQDAVVV